MKAWKQLKNKYGLLGFLALLLVLCTLLGVLFTQARYVEEAVSGSDIYDGDMEYIVAEQVEVESVEELIAAIENGYSNIKIADSVDNPLIITSGVTDVGTDLILDLNGHEIQRNNRDPMLNIENGVRLTIIDTSSQQEGSFYNPVGSVLQIGGGTLTVSAGAFISGPKKSEYAHEEGSGGWTAGSEVQSDDGLFALGGEGGTIDGKTADVTLYVENGGIYTGSEGSVSMPVITPFVRQASYAVGEEEQTYWFVNGNMYFDGDAENSLFGTDYGGVIMGDTYLYHVLDDSSVTGTQIAVSGSADFYYTYNVRRAYNGEGGAPAYTLTGDAANGTDVFTVTVYGYNNVKGSATEAANYATVKMLAGNMYVRGGSYTTNFGKATAYGVYASGGYMSVEAGSFEAIEGGVCIECAYTANSDEEYLRVADGSFRSDNGDTIRVSGGRMIVTGGAFYKDDSDSSVPSDQQTPAAGEPGYLGAIIRVTGGSLTATGSLRPITFGLTGSSQYGVYAENGTVTLTNAALTFAEGAGSAASYNTGVYATGAESSVTLTDTDITVEGIKGSGNYGVNAAANVSLNGNCKVLVEGSSSIGLLAQGGSITYTGESGDVLDLDLAMSDKSKQIDSVAMAALNGGITLSGTVTVGSDGMGVAVWAGEQAQTGTHNSLTLESGSLTVITTRATALYVSGGDMLFEEGTTVSVTSEAANDCYLSETDGVRTAMFNGVFVQNGSLTASGSFKAVHTGAGAAVCVDGGNATFAQGATVEKYAVTDGYPDPKIAAYYDGVRVMNGSLEAGGEFTVTHYGVGAAVYVNKGTAQEAEGAFTAEFGGNTTIYKYGAGSYDNNPVGALQDGVHIADGTMTVSGSFTVEHSGAGAAVYANGTVTLGGTATITKYAFTYSSSLSGVRYDGVYVAGSLTVAENGSFGVTHYGVGAAVYVANGTLTLNGAADITNDLTDVSYEGEGVSYDGVYVAGSLTANGTFDVTHKGIENDTSSSLTYETFAVRSYAVRVAGGAGSTVTITQGTIKNSVGGGVYVSGGGTVTLGNRIANGANTEQIAVENAKLKVLTEGNTVVGDYINSVTGMDGNWHYKLTSTGGHAVEVSGGTLNVESGTYSAAQGNGILVRGGDARIYNGSFTGNDNYVYDYGDGRTSPIAGVGASYAFKLYGGKVTVLGGTFGGSGSSAFVMGTSEQAEAYIYGGTFAVTGQAGFSVFQNVSITFEENGSYEERTGSSISVSAFAAAIAIENTTDRNTNVTIHGGTYTGTGTDGEGRDGIWYSNPNAKLTISGGTFTGNSRSGLFIVHDPNSNIQLSGGTFIGQKAGQGGTAGRHYWYNGGAIGVDRENANEDDWRYSEMLASNCHGYTSDGDQVSENNRFIVDRRGIGQTVAEHTWVQIR